VPRGDIPKSVQAMKHGASDFLTKPVNDEVLLAAIRVAIEKDRAFHQTAKCISASAKHAPPPMDQMMVIQLIGCPRLPVVISWSFVARREVSRKPVANTSLRHATPYLPTNQWNKVRDTAVAFGNITHVKVLLE
jgi:hypothetical protein